MKIEFKEQKCLLSNVNVRSEVHGEDREPAGDLKIEVDVDAGTLAEFDPALRGLLYYFDEGRERDLADQARSGEPIDLRMPHLEYPLRWGEEMLGARCRIKVPGAKSDVGLDPVNVNNWTIEPREGGTISLSFRVQCHPSAKDFGALAVLVQSEIEFTLETHEGN